MTQRLEAPRRTTDLTIVGAGAAGTHTLLALLDELSSPPHRPSRPVRITIVDRDPQFFTGVAYGARSGRAAVTLSTLEGFLPVDERARFTGWATQHWDGGESGKPTWRERMPIGTTAPEWDGLFIPRGLYGAYLADRAQSAIRTAGADGGADVELVTADVTAIDRSPEGWVVRVESPDGAVTEVASSAVVLAIGSPPVRRLQADGDCTGLLIDDVYDPGLDETLQRLHARLADTELSDRRILVVGGNATALEFVLASRELTNSSRTKITVLSPAGRPRHWQRRNTSVAPEIRAVTTLGDKVDAGGDVSAAELLEAVNRDLESADRMKSEVATITAIAALIPHLTASFSDGERAALAARYGMRISNLLRQDCRDSFDVLESLVVAGAVDFEAGRFLRCHAQGRLLRAITANGAGGERPLPTPYAAIVGAVGFETVTSTRSPLLRKMLRSGWVEPSSSDTGLRIDSKYQAAGRLFVVGPLLAGNAQTDMVIWHAESVRRIMTIARSAAKCIALELVPTHDGHRLGDLHVSHSR